MQEKIFIFTDGGARGNPGNAGAGVYIFNEQKKTLLKKHQFLGHKTNNEAEYLALQAALLYLQENLSAKASQTQTFDLIFHLDSKLVVEQMNKRWKIKEARLAELARQNWQILTALPHCSWQIKYVPREENQVADLLANQAMDEALV
jgi:ribonuclease HI